MQENKKASNAREDGQPRRRARQPLPLTPPGKPRRPARRPPPPPPPPRRAPLRARTGTPAAPLRPARPLAPGRGSLRPAALCRAVPARHRAREAACCSLVKSGQLCERSGRGRGRRRGRRTGAPTPLGSCRPSDCAASGKEPSRPRRLRAERAEGAGGGGGGSDRRALWLPLPRRRPAGLRSMPLPRFLMRQRGWRPWAIGWAGCASPCSGRRGRRRRGGSSRRSRPR